MIVNSKNIPNFAAANRKISCAESEISTQLNAIGVWCSWLAFLHGVQAVARSSRATPTKEQLRSLSCMTYSNKWKPPTNQLGQKNPPTCLSTS